MKRGGPVGCSHPEDSLPDLVSEVWSQQQAVQLLHTPLQQHSLYLLPGGAAPQQFIQDIQGHHWLIERGEDHEESDQEEEEVPRIMD